MGDKTKEKPKLILTTSSAGDTELPTFDDVLKFYRKLTGREPTDADMEEARQILRESDRTASEVL